MRKKKLRSDNWEPCLVINYFIEALEEKKNCPKRKGRRGRVFSNPYPQEENKEVKETLVERGHWNHRDKRNFKARVYDDIGRWRCYWNRRYHKINATSERIIVENKIWKEEE